MLHARFIRITSDTNDDMEVIEVSDDEEAAPEVIEVSDDNMEAVAAIAEGNKNDEVYPAEDGEWLNAVMLKLPCLKNYKHETRICCVCYEKACNGGSVTICYGSGCVVHWMCMRMALKMNRRCPQCQCSAEHWDFTSYF